MLTDRRPRVRALRDDAARTGRRVPPPRPPRRAARGAPAAYFGFAFDEGGVVAAAASGRPARVPRPGRARIRVVGRPCAARVTPAGSRSPSRRTASRWPSTRSTRSTPSDPMLFHKTTRRRRYDEATARHPGRRRRGADEHPGRGHRDRRSPTSRCSWTARWWTPPLDAGLLAGRRARDRRWRRAGSRERRDHGRRSSRDATAIALMSDNRGGDGRAALGLTVGLSRSGPRSRGNTNGCHRCARPADRHTAGSGVAPRTRARCARRTGSPPSRIAGGSAVSFVMWSSRSGGAVPPSSARLHAYLEPGSVDAAPLAARSGTRSGGPPGADGPRWEGLGRWTARPRRLAFRLLRLPRGTYAWTGSCCQQ